MKNGVERARRITLYTSCNILYVPNSSKHAAGKEDDDDDDEYAFYSNRSFNQNRHRRRLRRRPIISALRSLACIHIII